MCSLFVEHVRSRCRREINDVIWLNYVDVNLTVSFEDHQDFGIQKLSRECDRDAAHSRFQNRYLDKIASGDRSVLMCTRTRPVKLTNHHDINPVPGLSIPGDDRTDLSISVAPRCIQFSVFTPRYKIPRRIRQLVPLNPMTCF